MLDAAVDLIGKSGHLGSVALTGTSMFPTFATVERLAVEFSPTGLAFGDVLVFRQRGMLVVHRLVQRQRREGSLRLRTRGDGTIAFDPWLAPESVIGRVIAVGYAGGTWRNLRNSGARSYGLLVAAHALFWGGLGAVVLKLGGRSGPVWHSRLGRLDRFKLRFAHWLLFRALHPVVAAPDFDAPRMSAESIQARCYTSELVRPRKKQTKQ